MSDVRELKVQEEQPISKLLEAFREDTEKLGECTSRFITDFYPAYSVDNDLAVSSEQENSYYLLNTFTFYRICECSVYHVEDRFQFFAQKMKKLFTTAYSIKQEVCYGIVSDGSRTSLVLGVAPGSDDEAIRVIIEGLLPGVRLEKYTDRFVNPKVSDAPGAPEKDRYVGCICGVPALKIDGEYQKKDLSSLMRSLNGQSYTIMVLCKPVDETAIQKKINQAVEIQDECFAISKRTVSMQRGTSEGSSHTDSSNEARGENVGQNRGLSLSGAMPLAAAGATLGTVLPGVGNVVGAIGGGLIGLIVGKQLNFSSGKTKGTSRTVSQGYSDAVTKTINDSRSISGDIQNGFALELMKMAENMTERLKIGRSIGMWESVVTYSSDSKLASDIIQGSLYSEIASGIPEVLPPVVFKYRDSVTDISLHNQQLMIPKGFFEGDCQSPLCSLVTSEEICGICTIPADNTVGFEIKESKGYALNYSGSAEDKTLGSVCEYDRPLKNVPFGLSEYDLNKHTFVCGITGSGKTNTVKQILMMTDKPFLVIEPAKKEYRNIEKDVDVYTLGRPEINCLRLNPFYILPGVSPQQHIDLLKDLFSASFAFYGPMPYILEKCLYNIYLKKGWNLTLGFHPCLTGIKSQQDLFNAKIVEERYALQSHKYVFPSMQELKDEVDYYIENEMTYEGELKGNIRGAIKARIDSLCVGSKGFMFNTHEMTDFGRLLEHNSVLELEGLADDADKSFALGLFIIYINEYRQVMKEIGQEKGLHHLLVIEEAHRLLKNVSKESNEDLGNPKGKAVEHFTNMLAEMRSYGQGVIVAEQIPTKLAPDVIKNSSNKIVHRIIAKDDQEVIANSIGVFPEDAIFLGNHKTGYVLCHKEGMAQPVVVKINEAGSRCRLDIHLYNKDLSGKMFRINQSIIESSLPLEIDAWAVKSLVTMMYQPTAELLAKGLEGAYERIDHCLVLAAVAMIPGVNKRECVLRCISENIVSKLISGVFSGRGLPDNELIGLIHKAVQAPTAVRLTELEAGLKAFYGKDPKSKAVEIVAGLVYKDFARDQDFAEEVRDYMLMGGSDLEEAVRKYLRGK